MFTLGEEFDFSAMLISQLSVMLEPLTDFRRGILCDSDHFQIEVELPSEFGVVNARLHVSFKAEY